MNEDELHRQIAKLQSRSRRSTLLVTILPVAAVVALVAVAGSRLLTINRELQHELADRDAVVKKLTAKITQLEGEKEKQEQYLAELRASSAEQARLLEQFTTRKATPVTVRNATTSIANTKQIQARIDTTLRNTDNEPTPLVHLHIADEWQRDAVRRFQSDLIKGGYVAPGIENVGRKGAKVPPVTEVRYFRGEDEKEAQTIVGRLRREGVQARAVKLAPGKEQPRQFEIWFAEGVGTKPSAWTLTAP
jgi:hypothetical protein